MIGEAIYNLLSSHTGLTALVGTKIYPVIVPQDIKAPYVVFEIKTRPDYSKDGAEDHDSTVSILITEKQYKAAGLIAAQVIEALELITGTYNSTTIYASTCNEILDDYFDPEELFLKEMEFTFNHNKT